MVLGPAHAFVHHLLDAHRAAAANDTAIPAAAVTVLGALGAAATSGGFDLGRTFSLEGMLSVVTAFGKLLGLMRLFQLL